MKGWTPFIGIVRNLDIHVLRDEDFDLVEFQRLGDEFAAYVTIIGICGHDTKVSRRLQCAELDIEQALSFQWRRVHRGCAVFEIKALGNSTICKAFQPETFTKHQGFTGQYVSKLRNRLGRKWPGHVG